MTSNFDIRADLMIEKAFDECTLGMPLEEFLRNNRRLLMDACTFEMFHYINTNDKPLAPSPIKNIMFGHLMSRWHDPFDVSSNTDLINQFFDYTEQEKAARERILNRFTNSTLLKKRSSVVITSSFSESTVNKISLKLDIAPFVSNSRGLKSTKQQNVFTKLLQNDILLCQQEYFTSSTHGDRLMKILDQPIFKPFELTQLEKEMLESTFTTNIGLKKLDNSLLSDFIRKMYHDLPKSTKLHAMKEPQMMKIIQSIFGLFFLHS